MVSQLDFIARAWENAFTRSLYLLGPKWQVGALFIQYGILKKPGFNETNVLWLLFLLTTSDSKPSW
jgi:hypothetical protein